MLHGTSCLYFYFFYFFFACSERTDNEIAQEIQEQLVRQAEKQKQQEAKDEVRTKGSVTDYQGHVTHVFSVFCPFFFLQKKKYHCFKACKLTEKGRDPMHLQMGS